MLLIIRYPGYCNTILESSQTEKALTLQFRVFLCILSLIGDKWPIVVVPIFASQKEFVEALESQKCVISSV